MSWQILLQMQIWSSTKLGNSLTHGISDVTPPTSSDSLVILNPTSKLSTSTQASGPLNFLKRVPTWTLYSLKSTSSKYSHHSWWHCGRDNRWLVPPTHSRSLRVGNLLKLLREGVVTCSPAHVTFCSVHEYTTLRNWKSETATGNKYKVAVP